MDMTSSRSARQCRRPFAVPMPGLPDFLPWSYGIAVFVIMFGNACLPSRQKIAMALLQEKLRLCGKGMNWSTRESKRLGGAYS